MTGRARYVAALLRRPGLWVTAFGQAARLAPQRWWRQLPFLPVPDRRYLAFRMSTMYGESGESGERGDPADLIRYLEWCRDYRAVER